MLKTRIITALAGIPLILLFLYLGGWFSRIFFFLLGFMAIREMQSILSSSRAVKPFPATPYLLFGILFFSPIYTDRADLVCYLFVFVLVLEFIITYPLRNVADLALSFWGPVYIGFLLSYTIRIIPGENSFFVLLLAFLIAWGSDVGGYVFGRLWGKRKLVPMLSPKKTWAGFFGALVLTVAICLISFSIYKGAPGSYIPILFLGIIGSVAAQMGDLMMSGVKRTFQVKDTGSLIPGHGGILDRFDSFLMVVPVAYYFVYFFLP